MRVRNHQRQYEEAMTAPRPAALRRARLSHAMEASSHLSGWPSGLRRQFKALVFGRGFESHTGHTHIMSRSSQIDSGYGDVAQMVERALSMREVKGSMPFFSTFLQYGVSGPIPSSTLGVQPLGD